MRRDGLARLWFKSSFCLLASGLPRTLQADGIAGDAQDFPQDQVGSNHTLVVLLGPAKVGLCNSLASLAERWDDVNLPEPENP